MKRLTGPTLRPRAAALLVTAALAVGACSGAAATAAPTTAPAATTAAAASASAGAAYQVAVAQDAKLGAHLTGEDGKSLYLLTADSSGTSTCTAGCAKAWPPFELDPGETVTAGTGVSGALATIMRADDGKEQVTYNGIPLYYFAKDAKAGDVNGQGVKGVWFLVAPASTALGGAITGGVGQVAAAASSAPAQSASGGYTRGPAAAPSAAAAGSTGSSVQIANFAFAPADLKVKVGTTVIWTNTDGATHTVTADNGSFGGKLASGDTFKETFTKAGTYAYHCAIHSSMTGTVTVTS
ncbi:MAG TPA: plastocyanin/azurin family copper-binding protein [Candidatus Limnocylindrales bacterium]